MVYWRVITDVDGTLTQTSTHNSFLGNPLTPRQAIQPYEKITKEFILYLFKNFDTFVVSGNNENVIREFFSFFGIPKKELDSEHLFAGKQGHLKIEIYKQILLKYPSDNFYVFEDASTLLNEIFLLDPRRIFPINAKSKSIPGQIHDFLMVGDEKEINQKTFHLFFSKKYQIYTELQPYWIKIWNFTQKKKLKYNFGNRFLNFLKEDGKILFRIEFSSLQVFLPAGKISKGDLRDKNFDLFEFGEKFL